MAKKSGETGAMGIKVGITNLISHDVGVLNMTRAFVPFCIMA